MNAAHRNCYVSWAIGKVSSFENDVMAAVEYDRASEPVTRIIADNAIDAAERLEVLASHLRNIANRRIRNTQMEIENA